MIFTILTNKNIAPAVYEMTLSGDTSNLHSPGQFVNIEIEGLFLRRPISVCDWSEGKLTLIYKVVGKGTDKMAAMGFGHELDILVGLGNGFDTDVETDMPLLIGGGVGVPPMYALAKDLIAKGKKTTVIMGFNTAAEIFYQHEFEAIGAKVIICTADGSAGVKGFVTAAMDTPHDHIYACGPEPMLKAIYKQSGDTPAQLSFEERMGCGFGACMGCSCQTLTGTVRICVEGPVMRKEAIAWNV